MRPWRECDVEPTDQREPEGRYTAEVAEPKHDVGAGHEVTGNLCQAERRLLRATGRHVRTDVVGAPEDVRGGRWRLRLGLGRHQVGMPRTQR